MRRDIGGNFHWGPQPNAISCNLSQHVANNKDLTCTVPPWWAMDIMDARRSEFCSNRRTISDCAVVCVYQLIRTLVLSTLDIGSNLNLRTAISSICEQRINMSWQSSETRCGDLTRLVTGGPRRTRLVQSCVRSDEIRVLLRYSINW